MFVCDVYLLFFLNKNHHRKSFTHLSCVIILLMVYWANHNCNCGFHKLINAHWNEFSSLGKNKLTNNNDSVLRKKTRIFSNWLHFEALRSGCMHMNLSINVNVFISSPFYLVEIRWLQFNHDCHWIAESNCKNAECMYDVHL